MTMLEYTEFLDQQPLRADASLVCPDRPIDPSMRRLYGLQFAVAKASCERLTCAGFTSREFVSQSWNNERKQPPPQKLWGNIIKTVEVASILRDIMVTKHGARGLYIHAAYRPKGGARFSQHKKNRALDLQLMRSDFELAKEFYREAALFWGEYGDYYKMGLGLYCPQGKTAGIRIHIDTGHRKRTWQMLGGKVFKPPAALEIINAA